MIDMFGPGLSIRRSLGNDLSGLRACRRLPRLAGPPPVQPSRCPHHCLTKVPCFEQAGGLDLWVELSMIASCRAADPPSVAEPRRIILGQPRDSAGIPARAGRACPNRPRRPRPRTRYTFRSPHRCPSVSSGGARTSNAGSAGASGWRSTHRSSKVSLLHSVTRPVDL